MPNKTLADVLRLGVQDMGLKTIVDGVFPVDYARGVGAREAGFFSRWGFDTGSTWSGTTVTVDSALNNGTVWACVKLISETVATLPLGIFDRLGEAGKVSDHPLYEILHHQPNARMSAVSYWQAVTASLLLWGNAYSEITRASSGRIISLDFIPPENVRITRNRAGGMQYALVDGTITRDIPYANMMHVKSFSLDGEVGMSAIQQGRHTIGGAIAADRASHETFRDASKARGMATVDAILNPEQKKQVAGHINDVSKNGGIYVFEKGMSYQDLKFSPVDAELLASRSFSVEEICRWFRVPPVMIGHGDKQSSWPTSTDAQGTLFVTYVLRAVLKGIEAEIRRTLLSPAERQRYWAEYSVEGLLRGDVTARAAYYKTMLTHSIMTPNEVRRLENLPPLPGGDVLMAQANMIPLADLGKQPPPATPPAAPGEPGKDE